MVDQELHAYILTDSAQQLDRLLLPHSADEKPVSHIV